MKIFELKGFFTVTASVVTKASVKQQVFGKNKFLIKSKKMFQGHFHRHQHVSVMKLGLNVNILFSKIERSRIRKHGHEQIPVPWNVHSGIFSYTFAYYLLQTCKLYFPCDPLWKVLVFLGPGPVWKWYPYCFIQVSIWTCSNSIGDDKKNPYSK